MANQDPLIAEINKILEEDVEYKGSIDTQAFEKMGKSINFILQQFTNIKIEALSLGATSWTSPPNSIKWAVCIGFGGSGGGGGASQISNHTGSAKKGSNGNNGGSTSFNGSFIAGGGAGGAGGLSDPFNPEYGSAQFNAGRYSERRTFVQGVLSAPGGSGGQGDPSDQTSQVGGKANGLGGEGSRVGIRFFDNLSPNTSYPVVIGAGGSGGAKHPDSDSGATNGSAGSNGRLFIIYLGD